MSEQLDEEKRRIIRTAMGAVISDARTVDVDDPFPTDGNLVFRTKPKLLKIDNVSEFGKVVGLIEGDADSDEGVPACIIETELPLETGRQQKQRFHFEGKHVHLQSGIFDTETRMFVDEEWIGGDSVESVRQIEQRLIDVLAAVALT